MTQKYNLYKLTFFFSLIIILSSCGTSKKVMYDPTEVAYLSRQLKIPIANDDPNMALYAESSLWLGVPYRYGGNTKAGTDCSGFVTYIFGRVYRKQLERSSDDQAKKNVRKVGKGSLETGDLVFFNTSKRSNKINHVGIFLKNGYFVHASTSKGVIVSHLEEDYYRKTWKKGGRVK